MPVVGRDALTARSVHRRGATTGVLDPGDGRVVAELDPVGLDLADFGQAKDLDAIIIGVRNVHSRSVAIKGNSPRPVKAVSARAGIPGLIGRERHNEGAIRLIFGQAGIIGHPNSVRNRLLGRAQQPRENTVIRVPDPGRADREVRGAG